MPAVGEHYRPRDRGHEPGVYRVVGAPAEVTLLRVADADGRRVHSGALRHVPVDVLESEFEPAADPDAGVSPLATVRNQLQGLYWQVRKFR